MTVLRVLVTGATGTLGRAMRAMAPNDIEVVATSRRGDGDVLRCDLTDSAATTELLRDVAPDVVFHLAAVGVTGPRPSWVDVVLPNVTQAATLIDALPATARLIAAGSMTQLGATDPYGAAKTAVAGLVGSAGGTSVLLPVLVGPDAATDGFVGAALAAGRAGATLSLDEPDRERGWLATTDGARAMWHTVTTVHGERVVTVPAWTATVAAVAHGLTAGEVEGLTRAPLARPLPDGGPFGGWSPTLDLAQTVLRARVTQEASA